MENYTGLTQEKFDTLLNWLSPNRDEAGEKYEKIRQGLLRFFYFKGCAEAEDLADETINQVIKNLSTLDLSTENKLITVFNGFANNVYLEYLKKEKREVPIENLTNDRKVENENILDDKVDNLQEKLQRATKLLHTKNEFETLDMALEKIIKEFEANGNSKEETEEIDIDVHTLNRIPPKKGFTVKANFTVVGRRKPVKYDFADFVEDEDNL